MGFLSALIVGPCVAPPLAGALMYIGQTGNALLGGFALFVMSIGMGTPLLLIGLGAGKYMPKPGFWMNNISKIFGVIMLGVAIWMLNRVVLPEISMFLWSIFFIIISVYLGAFESLVGNRAWNAFFKGIGIIFFIIGVFLLVGVASGSNNILQPFDKFVATKKSTTVKKEIKFKKIHSIEELNNILLASRGKIVMVDFCAKWCVSCKELENFTFSAQNVQHLLKDYILVRADVSANSNKEQELQKKYAIFGPPAIIFFDKNGKLMSNKKIIGFVNKEQFLKIAPRDK